MTTTDEMWERFLDPEIVRSELFAAAMYITAFEILTDQIQSRIREFYVHGWNENGEIVDPKYSEQVLSRNRSALYASLDWLRENGVVDEEDLRIFEELKRTRNQLAHELFRVVTGQSPCSHVDQFGKLVALLRKVEVWWVVNVEIDTNPDMAGKDIKEDDIAPGTVVSLQMLLEVASGNTALLDHWRTMRVQRKAT